MLHYVLNQLHIQYIPSHSPVILLHKSIKLNMFSIILITEKQLTNSFHFPNYLLGRGSEGWDGFPYNNSFPFMSLISIQYILGLGFG